MRWYAPSFSFPAWTVAAVTSRSAQQVRPDGDQSRTAAAAADGISCWTLPFGVCVLIYYRTYSLSILCNTAHRLLNGDVVAVVFPVPCLVATCPLLPDASIRNREFSAMTEVDSCWLLSGCLSVWRQVVLSFNRNLVPSLLLLLMMMKMKLCAGFLAILEL